MDRTFSTNPIIFSRLLRPVKWNWQAKWRVIASLSVLLKMAYLSVLPGTAYGHVCILTFWTFCVFEYRSTTVLAATLFCTSCCWVICIYLDVHCDDQCDPPCPSSHLRSWELRTQKLKFHLMRTQSLNVLPLKPGVGQYIAVHGTLTARDFFLAYFYTSGPFTCIFSKTSPDFFLCWLWLTHGSCVGPQNKIGHPAGGWFPCWVPAEYK